MTASVRRAEGSAQGDAWERPRRQTRQGSLVGELLARTDEFRSAQELHAELRQSGENVGLATVYRHLQDLVDRGEVDVLRLADGEAMYRRCATESHHHHLVCKTCAITVEVSGPQVEAWAEQVAVEAGFTGVTHTVELFGHCRECSSKRPINSR